MELLKQLSDNLIKRTDTRYLRSLLSRLEIIGPEKAWI